MNAYLWIILVLSMIVAVPSEGGPSDPRKASVPVKKVTLREDNVLLVNDEPFFPIILYHATGAWLSGYSVTEENLEKILVELSSTGFNTLEAGTNELDRLHRHGFYALTGFNPEVKAHPALLAWLQTDEPNIYLSDTPEEERQVYDRIKSEDINHPCYGTLVIPYTPFDGFLGKLEGGQILRPPASYLDTMDILAFGDYPVPYLPIWTVGTQIEKAKQLVNGNKPVWPVIQAFRWDERPFNRYPTPEELKCMTYLAITHDVKGIGFYTYHDRAGFVPKVAPKLWSCVIEVVNQLEELSPIILAPTSGEKICGKGMGIEALLKEYMGKQYLIAVNTQKSQLERKFSWPSLKDKVKADVLFENRVVQISKGNLFDEFKGLEPHIYQISP